MQPFLKLDKFTFPSLLRSCAAKYDLDIGKKIHAAIIAMGLQWDTFIASALINTYVKCGSLNDAVNVFAKIANKDVTVWNCMIDGYFRLGHKDEGLFAFSQMQASSLRPDRYSLSIVLGACSDYSGLERGKQIHSHAIRQLFLSDAFLGAALIDMYGKCKRPLDAFRVFGGLVNRNTFIWNSMIGGFCQNGLWAKSLELFIEMKERCDEIAPATYSSVVTACSFAEANGSGEAVHGEVMKVGLECEPFVCTSLLTMYARFSLLEDAYKVFIDIPNREIELWNAMISAYIGNNYVRQALGIYTMMRSSEQKPDSITTTNMLSACSETELLDFGKQLHAELVKTPLQTKIAVQSALLTMYAKHGLFDDAHIIFVMAKEKDLIIWGSMIMGYCRTRKICEALSLFKAMEADGLEADPEIFTSIIGACGGPETVELGSQIHGIVTKNGMVSDIFVGCALIDMYSKCGLLEPAEAVFIGMTHKNLVAWNSMISSYSQNGQPDLSIQFLGQMLESSLLPDSVSIISALVAVSLSASLTKGKMIHCLQIRHQIPSACQLDNALVDTYIKSGCLEYARRTFDKMTRRNIVSWNSMMSGYGSHGQCLEAMGLFEDMLREGIQPDEVTFLTLISSCSHSGSVEEGVRLFHSMMKDYGIVPQMEHYANMVDLWGRAGYLDKAYIFIQSMPVKPEKSVWLSFLFACVAHHQLDLGELAVEQLLKLDPEGSSNYFQLLNLYGEVGSWRKAASLRVAMRVKGLKKKPGCSWIEVKDKAAVFFSGDSSSPWIAEIFATLKSLRRTMAPDDIDSPKFELIMGSRNCNQ